jgi:hypothetical protein
VPVLIRRIGLEQVMLLSFCFFRHWRAIRHCGFVNPVPNRPKRRCFRSSSRTFAGKFTVQSLGRFFDVPTEYRPFSLYKDNDRKTTAPPFLFSYRWLSCSALIHLGPPSSRLTPYITWLSACARSDSDAAAALLLVVVASTWKTRIKVKSSKLLQMVESRVFARSRQCLQVE